MPFWSITNVLILELAVIRRILSENACPKQHFSQPATLRDSWCPTLSISTDTRVPREVLGGGEANFVSRRVSVPPLQLLTGHPCCAACMGSEGTTGSPPSRASWGTQPKFPTAWPRRAWMLCTCLPDLLDLQHWPPRPLAASWYHLRV